MPRDASTLTIATGQLRLHNGILCFAYATFGTADRAFDAEEAMYADGEISTYEHVATVRVGKRWAILLRAG